jgi:DNA-directed RNA polymerase subunit L
MSKQEVPNGKTLLNVLVKLLAEQEGVKITYELKEKSK